MNIIENQGLWVFEGTRLSVSFIGKMLFVGIPKEEILEDYPYLSLEDLLNALLYVLKHPEELK